MLKKLTSMIILLTMLTLAACAREATPVPVVSASANLYNLEGDFRGSKTLAELMSVPEDTALALYTQAGSIIQTNAAQEVKARSGTINFQGQALRGIFLDPPALLNTYAFHWSLDQIDDGQQAMVVLIDGLGYEVYMEALEKGLVPNLAQGEEVEALTVYRPVTNAGLAAILTGETPDKNGIHDRSYREPQVPDILQVLTDRGKTGVVIEGAINILDLGGEVVLSVDMNDDGYSDDEILAAALAKIDDGYDYMLVHFHSLDDAGHSYGPKAPETMDRLVVLDQYMRSLLDSWPGPVLVAPDHGMHETEDGGNHGDFRYEDLMVPLIFFPGR